MNINYDSNKLNTLWSLLRNHSNYPGKHVGLKQVMFHLNVDDFRKKHSSKIINGCESIVTTNLDDAISRISNSSINYYHLSCVGNILNGANSAVCVHFKNNKDNKHYALAIPGTNYIIK